MDAQYHKEEPSTAQLVVKDQVRRRSKTTTPPPPGNGKKCPSPSSKMAPYTPPREGTKRQASPLEGEGFSTPPTKKAKWSSSPKTLSIARRILASLRGKKIDPALKKVKIIHFENGKKSPSPTPPQRGVKRQASLLEGEGSSAPPTKKEKWSFSPKTLSIARRMFAALKRKKNDLAPQKVKKCHFERNNIRRNLKIKYPSSRALGSPKSFIRMRRTRSIPLSQQQIPLLQGRNDILLTTSEGETRGN